MKRLEMEKEILKKSDGILCSRNEVKYSFITQHKNTCPISLQYQILGVKRSVYYEYVARQTTHKEEKNHQEMLEWIEDIAESSDHTYGSRRIKKALNILGYPDSRNKAQKLMREAGVSVKERKKYKVTTNSNHKQPVFKNLLERQFDVAQTDQAYAADVTYI
ncbi:MAG: IS3 family transposase [Candidatus Thiodiazotropha sp. (ex Lucinoma aequizonata)]|nr:IS3 family transposase [Candidatus Thiodiazotropha sp. (ex Lucinoma aequizonata)]